jgi:hypothetical protein
VNFKILGMARRIVVLPDELEMVLAEVRNLKELIQKDQAFVEDPILDTEGVMNLLKVSRRSLQAWRDEKIISFSQVNGKFYYRLSAINEMLDRHLIKSN